MVSKHPLIVPKSCGPRCLYLRYQIIGVLQPYPPWPRVFYRTAQNTLLKPKKHRAVQRIWGFHITKDLSSRTAAFAAVRLHQPPGVLIPLEECECAYEMPFVYGIRPKQLEREASGSLFTLEGRCSFIRAAKIILAGLHELGVRHGDPNYNNFLITRTGLLLIDLDDLDLHTQTWARWERLHFLRDTGIWLVGWKSALRWLIRNPGYVRPLAAGFLVHFCHRIQSRSITFLNIGYAYIRNEQQVTCDDACYNVDGETETYLAQAHDRRKKLDSNRGSGNTPG